MTGRVYKVFFGVMQNQRRNALLTYQCRKLKTIAIFESKIYQ